MPKKTAATEQERRQFQRLHMSRRLAVQAIYQWQMADQSPAEIIQQFRSDRDYHKADGSFFSELIKGVITQVDALDKQLAPFSTLAIERIDPIERAALRVSAYELKMHPEVPYKVVINEAVGLVKVFGASESHKFVNGILDKVWRELRPLEASVNPAKSKN